MSGYLCANQLLLIYPGCYLSWSYRIQVRLLTNGITEATLIQHGFQLESPGVYIGTGRALILSFYHSKYIPNGYSTNLSPVSPFVDFDHIYQPGEDLPQVFSVDPMGQVRMGTDVFDPNQKVFVDIQKQYNLSDDVPNVDLAIPGTIQITPGPRILTISRNVQHEFQTGDMIIWYNKFTKPEFPNLVLGQIIQRMPNTPWYLVSVKNIQGTPQGQIYFSIVNNYPVVSSDGINQKKSLLSRISYIPISLTFDSLLKEVKDNFKDLTQEQVQQIVNRQIEIQRNQQWPSC